MVRPHTLLTITERHCSGISCWEEYQEVQALIHTPYPPRYGILKICNECLSIIGKQKGISDIKIWAWNLTVYRRRALWIRLGRVDPQNGTDGKGLADMETMLRERFDDVLWVNIDPVVDQPLNELELADMLLHKRCLLRDLEFYRERWREVAVDSQRRLERAVMLGMDSIADACEAELAAQDVKYATHFEACLLESPELNLSILFKWR